MSLRERIANQPQEADVVTLRREAGLGYSAYQALKLGIHQKLLDRADLSAMESLAQDRLK